MKHLLAVVLTYVLYLPGQATAANWNATADKAVLNGYDVVAYYNEDRAVGGQAAYSTEYEGGTFYCSKQENQDAF